MEVSKRKGFRSSDNKCRVRIVKVSKLRSPARSFFIHKICIFINTKKAHMCFYSKSLFKKALSILITFFTLHPFSQAQSVDMLFNDRDSVMTIQVAGMSSFDEDHSPSGIVARKWGFRYVHLGCTATINEFMEAQNQEVYSVLIKKYGADWEKKFEEQVKIENKKEKSIKKSLNKLPLVKKVKKDFKLKEGSSLFYTFDPDKNLEIYHILMYGYAAVRNEGGLFTFGKFRVDSKTLKGSVISDKVEKLVN
jgi:hypothetical protein